MLDKRLVADILDTALSTGGDFAEVFVEDVKGQYIDVGENKVKEVSSHLRLGVGIRVMKGVFQTYAYTNILERENLLKAAKQAAQAINGEPCQRIINLVNLEIEDRNKALILPEKVKKLDKTAKMLEASYAAYGYNPLISRVDIGYQDTTRQILVANSDGVWAEDKQSRLRMVIEAIASKDNVSESALDSNIGFVGGFERLENYNLKELAEQVAQSAINKLDAENCPSGKMPVIIHNAFGGVIFHEACGHSLEAASVAINASEFAGKQGQKIASELVTAVDDATIPHAWGSINIDDEGTPAPRKVLIENGILKNYMIDKLGGRRMGVESNGASRRQNYKFIPTSRMSNTLILNGKSSFEEIIANTEYGLFAKSLSGGSVNPINGEFNFSVAEGFLVKNGQIKQQVKGAKLIGKGSDVLQKIDMVGNNMSFACGMCGAASGSLPVTVGQPTLRVSEITVGGQD